MKKRAVKISGLLTVIISSILFLCMAFLLCYFFDVSIITSLFQNMAIGELMYYIFSYPLEFVLREYLSLNIDILSQIIVSFFAFFTFVMLIWGIKEISLAKKDDESFARCRKSCAFMMVLKFLFFLYNFCVLVFSFVNESISQLFFFVNAYIGVQYFSQIIIAVICVITFINFIIPVLSFHKASRLFKEGGQNIQENQQYDNQDFQNGNYNPQGNNNGAGYQAPYYNAGQTEPINPSDITHPQSENVEYGINIIPGQDGVPINITQKGINDLVRLERLRASGAIDENNYAVMKQKICLMNIS